MAVLDRELQDLCALQQRAVPAMARTGLGRHYPRDVDPAADAAARCYDRLRGSEGRACELQQGALQGSQSKGDRVVSVSPGWVETDGAVA